MGREQHLARSDMPRQTGIARAPCRIFQSMSADLRHLYALHRAGNVQARAGLLRLPGPVRRMRVQPVIHVYRA